MLFRIDLKNSATRGYFGSDCEVGMNNKDEFTISKIEDLDFKNMQNQAFEEIHINNNYFTGKAKLYKDNAHIGNIVFILQE